MDLKEVSIEDYNNQRTSEEYNNIIDSLIIFSHCFDTRDENNIDLIK